MALCDTESFRTTFEKPSNLEEIQEKTKNPSSNNIERVMGNVEKDVDQVKIKNTMV